MLLVLLVPCVDLVLQWKSIPEDDKDSLLCGCAALWS